MLLGEGDAPAIAPTRRSRGVRERSPHLDRAARRIEAGRAGVLRARHERSAGVVARRAARSPSSPTAATTASSASSPTRAADALSGPVDVARRESAVVARRRARSRSCGSRAAAARRSRRSSSSRSRGRSWSRTRASRRQTAQSSRGRAAARSSTRCREPPAAPTCTGPPAIASSFLSYHDGWPHLYSIQHPGKGAHADSC